MRQPLVELPERQRMRHRGLSRPQQIGVPQLGARHSVRLTELASCFEEITNRVHVVLVRAPGLSERVGVAQAVTEPGLTPLQRPVENAGKLVLQLVPQLTIWAVEPLGERDQLDSSPDPVILTANYWPLVRRQDHLARRLELELALVKQPCRDLD